MKGLQDSYDHIASNQGLDGVVKLANAPITKNYYRFVWDFNN
jgi:hypothetical protein